MAAMIHNGVRELAAAPGSGAAVLLGGVDAQGYRPFAFEFAGGDRVLYAILGNVGGFRHRECGIGTFTPNPDTITRDTVLWNSIDGHAAPSRLAFNAQVLVYNTVPAECALYRDGSGNLDMASKLIANLAPGTLAAHAARMDQVGWQFLVQTVLDGTGAGSVSFPLPATHSRFRLEFQDFAPAALAAPYLRLSLDGGASYLAGASDYSTQTTAETPTAVTPGGGNAALITLGLAGTGPVMGVVEFQSTSAKRWIGETSGTGTAEYGFRSRGHVNPAGTANALALGFIGVSAGAGHVRLLGALA